MIARENIIKTRHSYIIILHAKTVAKYDLSKLAVSSHLHNSAFMIMFSLRECSLQERPIWLSMKLQQLRTKLSDMHTLMNKTDLLLKHITCQLHGPLMIEERHIKIRLPNNQFHSTYNQT